MDEKTSRGIDTQKKTRQDDLDLDHSNLSEIDSQYSHNAKNIKEHGISHYQSTLPENANIPNELTVSASESYKSFNGETAGPSSAVSKNPSNLAAAPKKATVMQKVLSSIVRGNKKNASKSKPSAVNQNHDRAAQIVKVKTKTDLKKDVKKVSPKPERNKIQGQSQLPKDKRPTTARVTIKTDQENVKDEAVAGPSKSNGMNQNFGKNESNMKSARKALEKIKFIDELTMPNTDGNDMMSTASAAWGDAFSIKSVSTDYSNGSEDNISIRTEDIVAKDDNIQNVTYPEIIDESSTHQDNADQGKDVFIADDVDLTDFPTMTDFSRERGQGRQQEILFRTNDVSTSSEHNAPSEELQGDDYDPENVKDNVSAISDIPRSSTSGFKTLVTKYNQKKFRWNHEYKSLTVKNCIYPITSENLSQCRGSLVSLKFSNLASFKIITSFLQNCSNLRRLSFSNISIVQKKALNASDPKIVLPNVMELEMTEWLLCLTKNEYWLLDYFTRRITFRKLHTFSFRGTETFVSEKNRRKCSKVLRKVKDTSAVAKFLYKNRDTLKKVSLGGIGFKIVQPEDPKSLTELVAVKSLDQLRLPLMNGDLSQGIGVLMKSQMKLSTLACSGYIKAFTDQMQDVIYRSIINNSQSLRAVGIFPCILQEDSTSSSTFQHELAYSIDCEIFENCRKLESLFLNITMSSRTVTVRNPCGRVFNLHALPLTLVKIELYNYEFHKDELDVLGKRFPRFVNLRKLILSSDKRRIYLIQIAWIKCLFSLRSFYSADFFGGKMDQPQAFQHYVLSKPKGFMTMVKVADCVSFYKNSENDDDDD